MVQTSASNTQLNLAFKTIYAHRTFVDFTPNAQNPESPISWSLLTIRLTNEMFAIKLSMYTAYIKYAVFTPVRYGVNVPGKLPRIMTDINGQPIPKYMAARIRYPKINTRLPTRPWNEKNQRNMFIHSPSGDCLFSELVLSVNGII